MDTATPRPMRLKIELTTAAQNALASSPFQLPAAKALATRLDMTRFSKVWMRRSLAFEAVPR